MNKSLKLHKLIYSSPTTSWDRIHEKNIYNRYTGEKWINVHEINSGWIHICNTLDDAKLWLKMNYHLFNHNRRKPFNWAIIECVIHKGVLYYRSFNKRELCAKELLTRKIVLKG